MDLTQLRPRTVNVTVALNDPTYRPTSASVPLVLRPPMLSGVSTAPEKTRQLAADFPGIIDYFRDFGADTDDTDRLPELPPLNGVKLTALPDAVAHISWKDDVDQLPGWLDDLRRPVYLTWYHEPMGNLPPSDYRATAGRVTQMVAAHPNGRWVLGHGPIVTRWWLDEGKGNPLDWCYPGMTHYGVDCYSRDAAAYWPASRMFGVAFGKIRAAYPGVRLLAPEYAMIRTAADDTGEGRAQAIRDHFAYLRQQPDLDGVAYWSNWAEYEIAAASPEAAALRAALA